MMTTPWEAWCRGDGCPFCAAHADDAAFRLKVATLSVSTLYLDRNQTYRGLCQLVFDRRHAVGLESLTVDEYTAFMRDLRFAATAVSAACRPDLMNYASLGNVVPHLHWHLIPRYHDDPRWGGPIYTTTKDEMRHTVLTDAEYQQLLASIRLHLASAA